MIDFIIIYNFNLWNNYPGDGRGEGRSVGVQEEQRFVGAGGCWHCQ